MFYHYLLAQIFIWFHNFYASGIVFFITFIGSPNRYHACVKCNCSVRYNNCIDCISLYTTYNFGTCIKCNWVFWSQEYAFQGGSSFHFEHLAYFPWAVYLSLLPNAPSTGCRAKYIASVKLHAIVYRISSLRMFLGIWNWNCYKWTKWIEIGTILKEPKGFELGSFIK